MGMGKSQEFDLTAQLGGDCLAAAIAGAAVSPSISAVDRALAQNASGQSTLGKSMIASFKEMFSSPIKFLKSAQFRWIWLVYGSTYAAANICMTYCKKKDMDVKLPKLISTFLVNSSTCIAKDRAFAKMYATSAPKPMPATAYGAWIVRDVGSMAVFFTLPPIVGRHVAEYTGNAKTGYYVAQMGLPLIFQTIFTPIHLLGYDCYNNPKNNLSQRVQFLKKDYWKNVGLRCVRQAPPWSFGTILNVTLREKFGVIEGIS